MCVLSASCSAPYLAPLFLFQKVCVEVFRSACKKNLIYRHILPYESSELCVCVFVFLFFHSLSSPPLPCQCSSLLLAATSPGFVCVCFCIFVCLSLFVCVYLCVAPPLLIFSSSSLPVQLSSPRSHLPRLYNH